MNLETNIFYRAKGSITYILKKVTLFTHSIRFDKHKKTEAKIEASV